MIYLAPSKSTRSDLGDNNQTKEVTSLVVQEDSLPKKVQFQAPAVESDSEDDEAEDDDDDDDIYSIDDPRGNSSSINLRKLPSRTVSSKFFQSELPFIEPIKIKSISNFSNPASKLGLI